MLCSTPGISAFPSSPENLLNWTATISGPSDTPYAALTFKLSFQFPSSYPYAPPTVLFKTPIFHPNVDFSGRICLDILKDKWSAVYNVQSVLLSLQSLLGEPNKYAPMPFCFVIPRILTLISVPHQCKSTQWSSGGAVGLKSHRIQATSFSASPGLGRGVVINHSVTD